MLDSRDKQSYRDGMTEIFSTLGNTNIILYLPFSTEEEDIYNESSSSQYKEKATMVGICTNISNIENPNVNIPHNYEEVFNIDIVESSFIQNKINPFLISDGVFKVGERFYTILDVIPKNPFSDFYTSYEFKCSLIKGGITVCE